MNKRMVILLLVLENQFAFLPVKGALELFVAIRVIQHRSVVGGHLLDDLLVTTSKALLLGLYHHMQGMLCPDTKHHNRRIVEGFDVP